MATSKNVCNVRIGFTTHFIHQSLSIRSNQDGAIVPYTAMLQDPETGNIVQVDAISKGNLTDWFFENGLMTADFQRVMECSDLVGIPNQHKTQFEIYPDVEDPYVKIRPESSGTYAGSLSIHGAEIEDGDGAGAEGRQARFATLLGKWSDWMTGPRTNHPYGSAGVRPTEISGCVVWSQVPAYLPKMAPERADWVFQSRCDVRNWNRHLPEGDPRELQMACFSSSEELNQILSEISQLPLFAWCAEE